MTNRINTMIRNTVLSIFLCVLFLNSTHSIENPTCIETSVCLCNLYDNWYIDISPLNKYNLTITNGNLTYYFYPCRNVSMNFTDIAITSNATNECASGTTLCLYNATDKTLTNLGLSSEGKFSNTYPKSLTYLHGDKETNMLLECTPDTIGSNLWNSSSNGNQHSLVLLSPYSCAKLAHPGLSIGSTLLILFSTFFGIYLIGGSLILHFIRGARGKEQIPNIDFWTGLPGLVKDGTIFVLTGCNPMVISSADTYDRI